MGLNDMSIVITLKAIETPDCGDNHVDANTDGKCDVCGTDVEIKQPDDDPDHPSEENPGEDDEEKPGDGEEEKPGNTGTVIAVVAIIVLVLGGGGAAFYLLYLKKR